MLSLDSSVSVPFLVSRTFPHGFVACVFASLTSLNVLLHTSQEYSNVFIRCFLTWFLRAALLVNVSSHIWQFWLLWTADMWFSNVLLSLHIKRHSLHFWPTFLICTTAIWLSNVLLSLQVNGTLYTFVQLLLLQVLLLTYQYYFSFPSLVHLLTSPFLLYWLTLKPPSCYKFLVAPVLGD